MRRRALLLAASPGRCAPSGLRRQGGGLGSQHRDAADGRREGHQDDAAGNLGFPAFATKNTTRVGGADASPTRPASPRAVFPGRR
jgi:hypothetical protein